MSLKWVCAYCNISTRYLPEDLLHEFAMLQLFSFTVKLPELICQELSNFVVNL